MEAIENSIIPLMETFESVENLSKQKYPEKQFEKITCALTHKSDVLRVATYNMLFNLYDQNLAPENRWSERLPRIVALIEDMNPDILGSQELQPDQVQQLLPFLEDRYDFFSVDSHSGEQNGIFYKKERFCVLQQSVVPMEPTDSLLTVVKLKDLRTGKDVAVCNAHFAFFNVEARRAQAKFVAQKVEKLAAKMAVIFMGDLNTFPNRPDTGFPAFDGEYIDSILTEQTLQDSINAAVVGHLGPIATFTNVDASPVPFQGTGTPGVFLDHIYVSKDVLVLIHAVQPATVDGHFPSDHMPVVIDCVVH